MRAVQIVVALAAISAMSLLTGCEKRLKAPTDTGVCYAIAMPEAAGEEPKFNVLARNQPQIEYCAARLEDMRINFLRMGGSNRDVVGAYQGQFIFINRDGVYFARSFEGVRFFALARTGDGRLAVPGAIERAPAAPATPAG